MKIKHFDSPQDFARDCQALGISGSDTSSWYGYESIDKALGYCIGGDQRLVPEAQKLVDAFRDCCDISRLQPRWQLEPVGAFPSIPDFLTGAPECMYRRIQDESERAPLTIWVCVTSSGGCEAHELLKRGVTVTALYMALSATRPVDLRVMSGLGPGDNIVTVRLPQPIALSEAAFALSNSAFSRGLTYEWLHRAFKSGGSWPNSVSCGNYNDRVRSWRAILGASETDIIFPHSYYGDADLSNPIGFAKQIMARFTHENE